MLIRILAIFYMIVIFGIAGAIDYQDASAPADININSGSIK